MTKKSSNKAYRNQGNRIKISDPSSSKDSDFRAKSVSDRSSIEPDCLSKIKCDWGALKNSWWGSLPNHTRRSSMIGKSKLRSPKRAISEPKGRHFIKKTMFISVIFTLILKTNNKSDRELFSNLLTTYIMILEDI